MDGDLEVGNGCVFGTKTKYTQSETVLDKTVIYNQVISDNPFELKTRELIKDGFLKKRVSSQLPGESSAHITFLHRILPNYHFLKKST